MAEAARDDGFNRATCLAKQALGTINQLYSPSDESGALSQLVPHLLPDRAILARDIAHVIQEVLPRARYSPEQEKHREAGGSARAWTSSTVLSFKGPWNGLFQVRSNGARRVRGARVARTSQHAQSYRNHGECGLSCEEEGTTLLGRGLSLLPGTYVNFR